MGEVLTHVVSTSALVDDEVTATGPVQEVCPRELIGKVCVRGNFECMCSQVETSTVYVSHNDDGPKTLTLTMHTYQLVSPHTIVAALNMTGLLADMGFGHNEVVARFDLRKGQNNDLREFVSASAL